MLQGSCSNLNNCMFEATEVFLQGIFLEPKQEPVHEEETEHVVKMEVTEEIKLDDGGDLKKNGEVNAASCKAKDLINNQEEGAVAYFVASVKNDLKTFVHCREKSCKSKFRNKQEMLLHFKENHTDRTYL